MDDQMASWDYQVPRMPGEGMISIDDIPGWVYLGFAWAALLLFAIIILMSELDVAHAATLSISGSAAGNGSQLFQVAGENITAVWNGTAWNVTGVL
jgi:hypothetical protein